MGANSVRAGEFETLNIGCGEDHRPDAWNVDIDPTVDPDEVIDLSETPWPWPDDAFRVVVARHVLEHLDPVPWAEIRRVLVPDGTLELAYPIGHTRFEDPTHQQFWNWHTAAAIGGERGHSHEHQWGFRLVGRDLHWDVPESRLWRTVTAVKLWKDGPGPWLSGIPGLYGHVEATFRVEP